MKNVYFVTKSSRNSSVKIYIATMKLGCKSNRLKDNLHNLHVFLIRKLAQGPVLKVS